MSTPERKSHSRNNHYLPLKELFPYLQKGNGIEAKICQTQEEPQVEENSVKVISTVAGFERGATLNGPGQHHRRALIIEPPFNPEMRQKGIPRETIWIERMTADNLSRTDNLKVTHSCIDSYSKVKVIPKAR